MLAEVPAVVEAIVQLDQLDALGAPESQFIAASRIKVVCMRYVSASGYVCQRKSGRRTDNDKHISWLQRTSSHGVCFLSARTHANFSMLLFFT